MITLRWMIRTKMIEKTRSDELRAKADVVTRTWKMEVGGHQTMGRSKLRWIDVIQKDTKEAGV